MKHMLPVLLLSFPVSATAQWVEFSIRSNGDVHFYDDARVTTNGEHIDVWTRVRYGTSVMAASSYQSLLRLDCSEPSEIILRNTYFTDDNWTEPAMAPDENPKPKTRVQADSASGKLVASLCEVKSDSAN